MTATMMSKARRGEIWSVDLGEPVGHEQGYRRPALVISSDRWNERASTVVVVPMTTSKRGFGTRVELEPRRRSGLSATSYARCDDIRSISTRRLLGPLGRVGLEEMHAVRRALGIFLEL